MKEFVVESYEGLDIIDRHRATLRAEADGSIEMAKIFRGMRVWKGAHAPKQANEPRTGSMR